MTTPPDPSRGRAVAVQKGGQPLTPIDMHVNANPDKRFFIDMLVKDIELLPAIVDLVDNSVDAARRDSSGSKAPDDWSAYTISIKATATRFELTDNCGGMELDIAQHYAFRFGRPKDFPGETGSVGQFGIGMKRAFFKLGREITIRSNAAGSRYKLELDVDEWERDELPDWSFQLAEAANTPRKKDPLGMSIVVTRLHDAVRDGLGFKPTISQLHRQLEMKHQPALKRGLKIHLNDKPLTAHEPRLLASDDVVPITESFTVPVGNGVVRVDVHAGVAAKMSRDSDRSDEDGEKFTDEHPAGWYVFCNERMVVAADKSPSTGWGSHAAAYHPQFRRFRGYVFMQADDSALLPWNTTKTSLDQDSPVFRVVQRRMFEYLKQVQAVLNRLKKERASGAQTPGEAPLTSALDAAAEVDISALPQSAAYTAPRPSAAPRIALATVQYKVSLRHMNRVMEVLGVDSYAAAGFDTFEYFRRAEASD